MEFGVWLLWFIGFRLHLESLQRGSYRGSLEQPEDIDLRWNIQVNHLKQMVFTYWPEWRNWQTRWIQNPVGVIPVRVRVPPPVLMASGTSLVFEAFSSRGFRRSRLGTHFFVSVPVIQLAVQFCTRSNTVRVRSTVRLRSMSYVPFSCPMWKPLILRVPCPRLRGHADWQHQSAVATT